MLAASCLGAVLASVTTPIFTTAQECLQKIGGIMRPEKETPRHEARGAVRACEDTDVANNTAPASIRQAAWWGQQACSCRGTGRCLCCRRFDRAIRAHLARTATAGGC